MKLFKLLCVSALATALVGCAHKQSGDMASGPGDNSSTSLSASACSGNRYLQRYGCSIDRVEAAAQNGDPDAQYALGYMYYYGMGTVRDIPTARLWIKRAASQDQPLAEKALKMIDSGGSLHSLHASDSARASAPAGYRVGPPKRDSHAEIDQMNQKTADKPLHEVLPKYGTGKASGNNKSVKTKEAAPPPLSMRNNTEHATVTDPRLASNARPMTPTAAQMRRWARSGSSNTHSAESAPKQWVQATPGAEPKTVAANNAPQSLETAAAYEKMLLKVPANHYTLQVMGGHDLASIRDFITKHNLDAEARFFRVSYQGKPWYVMIYGNYGSAMQAHSAAQQLPTYLRQHNPWVKSLAEVQKEIRSGHVS